MCSLLSRRLINPSLRVLTENVSLRTVWFGAVRVPGRGIKRLSAVSLITLQYNAGKDSKHIETYHQKNKRLGKLGSRRMEISACRKPGDDQEVQVSRTVGVSPTGTTLPLLPRNATGV